LAGLAQGQPLCAKNGYKINKYNIMIENNLKIVQLEENKYSIIVPGGMRW
jgi:hypothetical protein